MPNSSLKMTRAYNPAVIEFLTLLNHPLKKEVLFLRDLILDSNKKFTEHIKWNAPSFCYNNDDCITFNFPPKKDCIQLVFHRGAKVKKTPNEKLIKDESGLLDWKSNDRAVVKFKALSDIKNHETNLKRIIKEWINAIPSE